MAITAGICSSFKEELLEGIHDFPDDVLKLALYTSAATIGPSTTVYTTTGEITGTGYSAGGATVTETDPALSGTTAILDIADVSWTTATFTSRGALLYNSSKANRAILVLDWGSDKVVTAGTFTVVWPTADASNAILRVA